MLLSEMMARNLTTKQCMRILKPLLQKRCHFSCHARKPQRFAVRAERFLQLPQQSVPIAASARNGDIRNPVWRIKCRNDIKALKRGNPRIASPIPRKVIGKAVFTALILGLLQGFLNPFPVRNGNRAKRQHVFL